MDYVIDELAEFYSAIPTGRVPEQSWNIKPTNDIATILDGKDGVRHLAPSRWSFIPAWSKTSTLKFPTFNARIESVLEKPTYQHAAQFQRCIIPASGYYEWRNHKDPFYFSLDNNTPLSIAGLYGWWRAKPSDPWTLTSTIVTRAATENVASIHHRMPVFITPDLQDEWLDPNSIAQDILPAAEASSEILAMNLQFWQVQPLEGDGSALISKL